MMNATIGKIRIHLGFNYRWLGTAVLALVIGLGSTNIVAAQTTAAGSTKASSDVSDTALVRSLPGFENGYAEVNDTRLHYVAGGKGDPVILLPGWPETWWEFHKMMPELAPSICAAWAAQGSLRTATTRKTWRKTSTS
jgi:hypothetical protein